MNNTFIGNPSKKILYFLEKKYPPTTGGCWFVKYLHSLASGGQELFNMIVNYKEDGWWKKGLYESKVNTSDQDIDIPTGAEMRSVGILYGDYAELLPRKCWYIKSQPMDSSFSLDTAFLDDLQDTKILKGIDIPTMRLELMTVEAYWYESRDKIPRPTSPSSGFGVWIMDDNPTVKCYNVVTEKMCWYNRPDGFFIKYDEIEGRWFIVFRERSLEQKYPCVETDPNATVLTDQDVGIVQAHWYPS